MLFGMQAYECYVGVMIALAHFGSLLDPKGWTEFDKSAERVSDPTPFPAMPCPFLSIFWTAWRCHRRVHVDRCTVEESTRPSPDLTCMPPRPTQDLRGSRGAFVIGIIFVVLAIGNFSNTVGAGHRQIRHPLPWCPDCCCQPEQEVL